jgi:ABC-type branched-subunit amino acid transport system ATPase component/ABC-type branched-subunit amino acid transport system permease subunit
MTAMKSFSRLLTPLSHPLVHSPLALAVILVIGLRLGPATYWGFLVTLTLLYAIAALGLNIPGGFLGALTMGQGAVFAIGAYVSAILTAHYGLPIMVTVPVSFLAGGLVGLLMAAPAARLDKLGLGMVTLGLTIIVGDIATNLSITGGPNGLTVPPAALIPGGRVAGPDGIYALIAFTAVLTYVGHWYLRLSNFGRSALATKSDQLAATAFGMNTYWLQVLGFSIGSALGALGGGFYGYVEGFVSPGSFGADLSVLFLLMILFGGAGSRVGPVLGIVVIGILPLVLTRYPSINIYVDGALLIVVMRFMPRGICARSYAPVRHRKRRRVPGAPAESLPAESLPGEPLPAETLPAEPLPGRATAGAWPRSTGQELLVLDRVSRSFGGVLALDQVDIELTRGQVMAVVGPNGSGKTTLMNVICGYYPAQSGSILLTGRPIQQRRPAAIARMGVARTFQVPKTFRELSIDEHVALAEHYADPEGDPRLAKLADSFLREVGILGVSKVRGPRELDHGHLRFLEIGNAIARRPRLLLLDEPAAGLSSTEIERLLQLITDVTAIGSSVMLVEHHLDLVCDVADTVVVMHLGKELWHGEPGQLRQSDLVREAYLGAG